MSEGMRVPVEDEVDIDRLRPLHQIGDGDRSVVFEQVERPHTVVYKEYLPDERDRLRAVVLRAQVSFVRELDEDTQRRLTARAAWPINVVHRDGEVSGFLMPRAPGQFTAGAGWPGMQDTERLRLEFLSDVAETLALLHDLGIVVGELSSNNILFRRWGRPHCYFVDCDTMRLGETSAMDQVQRRPDDEPVTAATDCREFALLALRTFTARHAHDEAALAKLPEPLRPLVTSGVRDVREWLAPLAAALQSPTIVPQPRPVPQRYDDREESGSRVGCFLVPGAFALIAILVGLSNTGSHRTTTVYLPLPTASYQLPYEPTALFNPSDDLSFPVPVPSPCTVSGVTPTDLVQVEQVLDTFVCGLDDGDYTESGGPSSSVSQADFATLADNAHGAGFQLTIQDTEAANASDLRADTKITNGTACWSVTFRLAPNGQGGYAINSIGVPEAITC